MEDDGDFVLPEVVVKEGAAREEGYAALFAELCSRCHLQAHLVCFMIDRLIVLNGSFLQNS